MAFIYNVTFDASEPIALASFWSAATGYTISEQRDDFVRLRAPDQRSVRHILFFKVDDPTPGKNRSHVDLASHDPDNEVARLISLGATLVDIADDQELVWRMGNGTQWVAMRDPEGNEFCIG